MDLKIAPYKPELAAELATMWNESIESWPFGFGGGIPFTEQRIKDWMASDVAISNDLLVTPEGRVVGYCQMMRYYKEPEAAYVSLLNVHPHYQGKKAGKALLKAAVERSVDMKVRRLDLNTWPSNMKAVPLYKKCGFFWVPETSVYMQNYLPLIMQQPVARDFFARHDWYDHQVRPLEVAEDDETWQGTHVFRYEWQAGGERLGVTIDRESRAVTAVETGEWSASCRLSEPSPAAGMSHRVFWHFENRKPASIPFYLRAFGNGEFAVKAETTGEIVQSETHEGLLEIPADARVSEDDRPAAAIRTLLVIDSRPVTLETGVRVTEPLTVELSPEVLPPYCGQPVHATVCLKNNLSRSLRGRLRLTPGPELAVDCDDTEFEAAAHIAAGVPVVLRAAGPGLYRLEAVAEFEHEGRAYRTAVRTLSVPFVPLGGILAGVEDRFGLLETDHMRIRIARHGGEMTFTDRATGILVGSQQAEALGPPFWPSEFAAKDLEIESGEGFLRVKARSLTYPGVVLEKTVRANSGPIVAVSYRVSNLGNEPIKLQLMTSQDTRIPVRQLAIPLATGLIVENQIAHEFPAEDSDFAKDPRAYAESWFCAQGGGLAFGVIWQGPVTELPVGWTGMVTPAFELGEIAPGGTVEPPPLYLFVGDGDYQAVRRYWQTLVKGISESDAPAPAPRRGVEASMGRPLVVRGGGGNAVLRVSNPRNKPLGGTLVCHAPEGWEVKPNRFDLQGIDVESEFTQEVSIRAGVGPSASMGKLSLATPGADEDFPMPCIHAGSGGDVGVAPISSKPAAATAMSVDNGLMRYKVDPAFYGSCYSIEYGGREHLKSAHPAPGAMGPSRPWYGGIHPAIWGPWGALQLYRESFQAAETVRTGLRGWEWRGVETIAPCTRKGFENIRLSTQFLTLGGSNLMAVVSSATNLATAPAKLTYGTFAYLGPGGEWENSLLHFERDGRRYLRKRGAGYADTRASWAAVENPDNGHTILAIAPTGCFSIMDRGQHGAHLMFVNEGGLGPGETTTRFYYLILLERFEGFEPYLSLLGTNDLL